MSHMAEATARRAWPAVALFALLVAEGVAVVVGVAVTGMSFAAARDSFMISNAAIGIACGVCGVLIAGHRPRHVLGWLLLGAGVTQTGTAAVTPWLVEARLAGASEGVVRALSTVYSAAWPWSISLFLPLAILVFPDGRLPGRWWRPIAVATVINSPLQVLLFSADPDPLHTVHELPPGIGDGAASWWLIPGLGDGGLDLVSELVLTAAFVAGLVGLLARYRRGDERTRRQLLWLLLAMVVTVVVVLAERLLFSVENGDFPIILTVLIALVPIAMAVAVLRYQLLDIRLVWSRTVTYALLTAAVAATYVVLVELGDRLLRREIGLGTSVLATLVVAVAFNPVRSRLQRQVDRLLYGERADPVRAVSSVTAQLATGAERPADVLPALCDALRLPYAGVWDADGVRGEHGVAPEHLEVIPLHHAGERLGELRVGVRSGQRRLDPADRAVLELMAVPIGVAVRANALTESLRQSRQELVAAREEERRRIRRDLHDGLGPVLTGIAFQADLVVAVAETDTPKVRTLAQDIRSEVTGALTDVRRLIYELRPPALDELGLVEAVRRHAQRLDRRADGAPIEITVRADAPLPELPAAVEVAAYRILTEALTNVARHSHASRVDVDIVESPRTPPGLELTVQDDSAANGSSPAWTPGVGLRSMHERATELCGTVQAEPTPTGGRVHALLPLGADR